MTIVLLLATALAADPVLQPYASAEAHLADGRDLAVRVGGGALILGGHLDVQATAGVVPPADTRAAAASAQIGVRALPLALTDRTVRPYLGLGLDTRLDGDPDLALPALAGVVARRGSHAVDVGAAVAPWSDRALVGVQIAYRLIPGERPADPAVAAAESDPE